MPAGLIEDPLRADENENLLTKARCVVGPRGDRICDPLAGHSRDDMRHFMRFGTVRRWLLVGFIAGNWSCAAGDSGGPTGAGGSGAPAGTGGMATAGASGTGDTGGSTGGAAGTIDVSGSAGVGAGGSSAGGTTGSGGMPPTGGSGGGARGGAAGTSSAGGSGGAVAGTTGTAGGKGGTGPGSGGASGTGGLAAPANALITSASGAYWKTGTWTESTASATVTVNDATTYQTWEGFGGAFNEKGWSYLTSQQMKDQAIAAAVRQGRMQLRLGTDPDRRQRLRDGSVLVERERPATRR